MSRTKSTPIWPIMLTLTLLFGVSVTAPRGWENFADRRPLERPSLTGASVGDRLGGSAAKNVERSAEATVAEVAPAAPQPRVARQYPTPYVTAPVNSAPANSAPAITEAPAARVAQSTLRTPSGPTLVAPTPSLGASQVVPPAVATPPSSPTATAASTAPTWIASSSPREASPALAAQSAAPAPSAPAPYRPAVQPRGVPRLNGLTVMADSPAAATIAAPSATAPVAAVPVASVAGIFSNVSPRVDAPVAVPKSTPTADPTDTPTRSPTNTATDATAKTDPPANPTIGPAQPRLSGTSSPRQPAPLATASDGAVSRPTAPELVARRDHDVDTSGKLPLPKTTTAASPSPTMPAIVATDSWWPKPVDLLARFERLRGKPDTQDWAEQTERVLAELTEGPQPTPDRLEQSLAELRRQANVGRSIDEARLDATTAVELRLARHALERRLDIWESLAGLLTSPAPAATVDADAIQFCLDDIRQQTDAAGDVGRQWRDYLLIDSLAAAVDGGTAPAGSQALAREVLARLHRAGEALEQNEFLKEGAFATLDRQLRRLAVENVDGRRLLESIEKFEVGGLPSDAKSLAQECRLLEFADDDRRRQLAVWLTSHYRNSNIRLTLSSDFLNRLMPDDLRRNAPVRETILGNPTHGWSTSRTGISIRFLPSEDTLAVRFEAQGSVHAQTQTFSGPVRLFSNSDSQFTAYKDLVLTTEGFVVSPAVARSQSRSRLRGIRTEFDHLPIIGPLVESIAMDQHAEKRAAAQREASMKISRQAEMSLDAEIGGHLRQADEKLNARVIGPLHEVGLAPEVIELQSNESRAIVRLRIAGDDQLAGYTPRPRAYNDNVGSLQIHQSAVNNLLERAELEGRRFTARELCRHIVERFRLPYQIDPEMIPDDVEVTFARADAMTVRFDGGQIELRLAIDELRAGSRSWREFVVRAQFKPSVVGGETYLVRDGLIRLGGPRLSTTSQISLRSAFAKVFPDDLRIDLWPDELRNDARFDDLTIAQLDLRDGWLGVAVGPLRHFPHAALLPPNRR